ncbi:OmpA family protein [Dyadobacter sp. NIV53]|uniref:OmpA family protein n=1 Tax=Dyadobacter sp. NIV53 TaxID=2861765 RepID=UPI001C869BCA|nr:OmpA family protein [Dyadobacter sp. NIV53]
MIVQEDFSKESLGDFPSNWNTRSGAELVTINTREGKWLRLAQTGVFYPEYITDNLPENFTLQIDLLANQQVAAIGQWMVSLLQTKDTDEKFRLGEGLHASGVANFQLNFQPGSSRGQMYYSTNLIGSQSKSGIPEFHTPEKPSVKISIWRQKQRIRVYLDSTKVLDLPRALDANATLNSLVFSSSNPEYDSKEGAFFMSNIRLAVGAPNLRSKLMNEGKFSTNGILFDVNSDQIKPQSYGSLQDIAQLLKENTAVKVKIIGHTDADGDDHANLELSKRRALAVVQALTTTFGIDASRLQSDGKGKSEPVDNNDTSAGKANNRRVEFIKL